MLVPVCIYTAFNWGHAAAMRGWAIPAATDIAFALGLLALLGPRIPPSLKIFLAALAILDDLGAILIIALAYGEELRPIAFALAAAGLIVLMVLNRAGVAKLWPYLLVGTLVWAMRPEIRNPCHAGRRVGRADHTAGRSRPSRDCTSLSVASFGTPPRIRGSGS